MTDECDREMDGQTDVIVANAALNYAAQLDSFIDSNDRHTDYSYLRVGCAVVICVIESILEAITFW